MIQKEKGRISAGFIFVLFAFTYFISYITRINYGAVISEMVTQTGLAKSELSVALTGCAITYGVGQLISGYFGDKVRPKLLITLGLCVTTAMNFLIPLCSHPSQMLVVWCINGFAQAFMWPPMVKLMTALLTAEEYARGSVKVSWGSSFGTIFVYLVSPIIIAAASWKYVFTVSALMGLIGIIIWYRLCPDVEVAPKQKVQTDGKSDKFSFPVVLLFIMLAIALQGILRDGVQTWMPSYLSETFGLENEIAILTGVVLPIFSILCYQASSALYTKVFPNAMVCATVIFGVAAGSALLLYIFAEKNPAISVVLSALLTGCMHGVNVILICMVPACFSHTGRVAAISGMLNACTYVGSAASNYLFPLVSENLGWGATVFMWVVIAGLGAAICFACAPAWKKYQAFGKK